MRTNSSAQLTTVSDELAKAYIQSIQNFVDKGDATCIEIKYLKVGYPKKNSMYRRAFTKPGIGIASHRPGDCSSC